MKQVIQLDADGFFTGITVADESPKEPGVYLYPANAIDAPVPEIPEGQRAKWDGSAWQYEIIPPEKPVQPYPSWTYNETTFEWEPPIPKSSPDDEWDEEGLRWKTAAEANAEREAAQERQQANEEYEPARLAPALKVLAEKLLTADIAAETLPEKDAQAVTLLFPKWEGNGVAYPLGRVLQFNHHLYEVMQPHTSQADWAPDVATTLFRRRYAPTGGIPEWQPWDGHNDSLHQIGSEVMLDGIHWISTVPNNHWRPGEYGWDQVV